LEELASSVNKMQQQHSEMKDLVKNLAENSTNKNTASPGTSTASNKQFENETKIAIAELRSELKKINVMLLDQRNLHNISSNTTSWNSPWPTSPTIPTWQRSNSSSTSNQIHKTNSETTQSILHHEKTREETTKELLPSNDNQSKMEENTPLDGLAFHYLHLQIIH
jgi:hypothetical protein